MTWILARGTWNSLGEWDDTDIWRDGPSLSQMGGEVIHPVFDPVSNLATWEETMQLFDTETGEPVDLSSLVDNITVTLRDPGACEEVLEGDFDGGEVFLLPDDDGGFGWVFTNSQMASLAPKTYEVGILATQGEDTIQLVLGRISVLRGL